VPDHDASALTELLRKQRGLITLVQATESGISALAVRRRVAAGRWHRVLPRVYLTADLELSEQQRIWAAVLYAGEGTAITGMTALRWHRIKRLPPESTTEPIHISCPVGRRPASRDFVVVQRSTRFASAYLVDDVRTMPVPRATVDAAARLSSYEPTLELLTAVIRSGRVSLSTVAEELTGAPNAGTRWLRRAVAEATLGSRSVAEALARQMFAAAGFPTPLVNGPIEVDGTIYVPDFRWGRVIVEIDSKEWHLLHSGSWEATLHRRMLLTLAGYHVIPVSPSQLKDSPELVLSMIRAALAEFLGWFA
jgi:hypothetical protein